MFVLLAAFVAIVCSASHYHVITYFATVIGIVHNGLKEKSWLW